MEDTGFKEIESENLRLKKKINDLECKVRILNKSRFRESKSPSS